MSKTKMWSQMSVMAGRIVAGCGCFALVLLAACGSSEPPAAPPPEVTAPVTKSTGAAAQVSNPLADMVKAVPAAVGGAQPAELRFEIVELPVLGELFDVNLNVLALADAAGLELKVDASPNLSVVAGGESSFGALKTGESVRHTLQLRASASGISVLDVQLVAIIDGQSATANFAIPVALVEAPATAAATAGK